MMNKGYLKAACSLIAFFGMTHIEGVRAQTVDYQGLEEIYGEPVTKSANGSPLKQSDAPLNMEIITADEIQKSGARSIPEILRFIPGLSVLQKTYGQTEVSIRGYNQNNADRILVLLNGRQVYTDFFGQVQWGSIPVEINEIQQIEVVKGPNTALFGFNAVSGVINIITFEPFYKEQSSVQVNVGTQGMSDVSATTSRKITDKLGIRASVGTSRSDHPFDDIPSIVQDSYERDSFAINTSYKFSENIQGQISATINENNRADFIIAGNTPDFSENLTKSIRGKLVYDSTVGDIEADIYHNVTAEKLNLSLLGAGSVSVLDIDNSITVAKLSDTFSVGSKNIFRISGEYRTAKNQFIPVDSAPLKYDIYSVSGLWDWQATEKLRTSVAARYDSFQLHSLANGALSAVIPAGINPFTAGDYNQDLEAITWNLGAVYKLNEDDSLRASIARGAGLPSFTDFGVQFLALPNASNPDGNATLGNPYTRSTIVDNFEIGYDHKIDDWNGLFRSAIFFQHNEDIQGFSSTITHTPNVFGAGLGLDRLFIGNIGDSDMYGVEMGLEGKYKENWSWGVNYTLTQVNDRFNNRQNSADFSSTIEYENSNIDHILNLHLGYEAEKWRADAFVQYTSPWSGLVGSQTQNSHYTTVDIGSQVILNANFAYKLTDQLTWAVSGTGLAGKTTQSGQSSADTVLWTSLSYKF